MKNQSIQRNHRSVQVVATITLINAAIFIPAIAIGLLSAYRAFATVSEKFGAPHLGVILALIAQAVALLFIVGQALLIVFSLLSGRNPGKAIRGMFSGSVLGSIFAVANIVFLKSADWLLWPGTIGILTLTAIAGLWPLIANFLWPKPSKDQPMENGETSNSKIMQRKGTAIVIITALVMMVISGALAVILLPTSALEDTSAVPGNGGLSDTSDGNGSKEGTVSSNNQHAETDEESKEEADKKPPSATEAIAMLAGEWDMEIGRGAEKTHGTMSVIQIGKLPWVLQLGYVDGKLGFKQLTGYDSRTGNCLIFNMIEGKPKLCSFGNWLPSDRKIMWKHLAETENMKCGSIQHIQSEQVESSFLAWEEGSENEPEVLSRMRLTRRVENETANMTPDPVLDRYCGKWNTSLENPPSEKGTAGSAVAAINQLHKKPALFILYFDEKDFLIGFRTIFGGSAFGDAGPYYGDHPASQVMLQGAWDSEKESMTWSGKPSEGVDFSVTENFSIPNQITSVLTVQKGTGGPFIMKEVWERTAPIENTGESH